LSTAACGEVAAPPIGTKKSKLRKPTTKGSRNRSGRIRRQKIFLYFLLYIFLFLYQSIKVVLQGKIAIFIAEVIDRSDFCCVGVCVVIKIKAFFSQLIPMGF